MTIQMQETSMWIKITLPKASKLNFLRRFDSILPSNVCAGTSYVFSTSVLSARLPWSILVIFWSVFWMNKVGIFLAWRWKRAVKLEKSKIAGVFPSVIVFWSSGCEAQRLSSDSSSLLQLLASFSSKLHRLSATIFFDVSTYCATEITVCQINDRSGGELIKQWHDW